MFRNAFFVATFVSLLFTGSARADWGTLTGQFILDGSAPSPSPVVVTKDQEVCGKHDLVDESLVVNPDNKGIANVVLYLYLSRGKKEPKPHPDYAKTSDAEVRLDNKDCRYEPHVQLLRTSQTLVVGNLDPVGHNTKVDTVKNVPINPIIPANGEIKQQFPKEERLPSKVSCSIHPWMNAILVIKDTPYMAVTDENGKFAIENLPEGEWEFQVWHEKAGYIDGVTVDGKKTKWSKGRFEHKVKAGENDLGEIKVPMAAFK
jgi:hypothetical protein